MADKSILEQWILEAEKKGAVVAEEPERKIYSDRIVAWIDILGMRNKMRKSNDAEEIFNIMAKLQHFVENACEDLFKAGVLNFLQLSDGFIIVSEMQYINELCEILCEIQWHVLLHLDDLKLLRGAVTAGKVSMSEDARLIIGPAFIEAYAMESDNAIFPRILFADEIYQHINPKDLIFKHIKEDGDHFKYLDFITYSIKKQSLRQQELAHLLETNGVFKTLKHSYESNISTNKTVAQKYGWLIAKLSENKIDILGVN